MRACIAPRGYKWRPPLAVIPLCACGCGKPVLVQGRKVSTFLKNHSRRKHSPGHSFDPVEAQRNEYRHRKYALTPEAFAALLLKQGNRCAICRTREPSKVRGDGPPQWRVDHCHKTNKVRGLLCIQCNAGLGQFRDDAALLEAALDYLERGGVR